MATRLGVARSDLAAKIRGQLVEGVTKLGVHGPSLAALPRLVNVPARIRVGGPSRPCAAPLARGRRSRCILGAPINTQPSEDRDEGRDVPTETVFLMEISPIKF